jgi:hypothetical protein
MKTAYVDLARRFVPFEETAGSEEAAWLSYYRPSYIGWRTFNWDELVGEGSQCIVVLGEAGSGKSWEFEARAEILNSRSVTAFFVPLEDLVGREIEQCLKRTDVARFERWLGGVERAVFLLDSLDEARLKSRGLQGRLWCHSCKCRRETPSMERPPICVGRGECGRRPTESSRGPSG